MNIIDNRIYENLDLLPPDLRGWNGNSEVFEKLISELNPAHIIEVGTWKGQSAINMANSIKKLGLQTKITCVDTWLGALEFWDWLAGTEERNLMLKNGYPNIYYQFLSNVVHTENQNIITPFPNTSRIAYYFFKKKGIKSEMIYIDASHEYEDVIDDIKSYYEILSEGGIIFGDDFYSFEGVRRAVLEFSASLSLRPEIIEKNFWIIRKPKK